MHRLFEERAAEAPGAPAVSAHGFAITYAELNAWANRLARHLQRLGIGPETVTALLLERSPELIVAALATFKAGGAYLPIDPAQPAERVDYIVKDSEAGVLLTTAQILHRFHGISAPGGVVVLDQIPDEDGVPLGVEVGPESLAYVIYTSGSTGAPKGAELCHGGLSNVSAWNRAYYDLGPGERVSMVASPGFDASIWEMWPTLSAGASLHLPPREVVLSPPDFLPWAAREGITVSWLPAPLADAVLAEPIPPGLRLRKLQSGGDRLLRRPNPAAPFLMSNTYGPTEASIVSTVAEVPPQDQEEGLPHIGRALTNVNLYFLDADLKRVSDGAEGELFLGGVGVGRGYRRRPALTAEKFVPDPFSSKAGQRLYRTGDLVRLMPSGNLEFLGRIDHQVKIRGNRVELGEIEAALLRHPEVREATVLARDGRLVGYVAERSAGGCEAEDLRAFLALSLPEVMIPSGWVFLDALPLTGNGKVDRKALARIAPAEVADPATVAPRTPAEAAVAGIWAEVLGLGRVGVEDDFFALGGHSLLASRVASRVREALGADPGVRGIFDHPTVAALAAWVDRQDRGGAAAAPLAGLQVSGAAPLSFAQQRLWFVERLRPGTAVYNLAQTVDLRGGLSAPALVSAFAAVIRRHEALRTVFAAGPDGEPVQIVGATWDGPALPVVDFEGLPEGMRRGAAERICREEARRPYDLERGPLLRPALLAFGPAEHRLFVGLHHIVSDAWSIGVLMGELSAFYRGADLPPLPVQYPGYAVWQRRGLADDSVAPRAAWWRAQLEGAPDVLDLPADRLRPAAPSLRGERLRLDLGPEMEEALAAWSRERGATLFMTLLAAFQILVGRFTGQYDFVLGTPVAGRDRAELEGMIGFFVNLLPLRARLTEGTTFRGLVAAVRESVLAAFAHQDLPFDRLVEELAPVRDPSRAPLVQVVFAIQDAPAGPDLGALGPRVTAAAEVATGASELDFVLFMERGGPERPGLAAIAEYATDLFDSETVRRLLANFQTLLGGIVADPERAVDELPLLSAREWDQAIFEWNRTEVPLASLSVDRLFEEHARRTPGSLAVSAGEVAWTYGELSSRVAAVRHRLLRLGAGPEALVGLLLERSPELILAVVATLESGAAYLPVDPAWPADRVEQILRDAGVQALLSTGSLLERFSGLSGLSVPTVRLDSIGGDPEPGEAPEGRPAGPDNLAYVIYTSGSTGAPKGAELHHRGLSNLAGWSVRRGGLAPGERVSMVAAPGFDASVWEIWPALAAGASLYPAPPEVVLRPAAFLPWAAAEGITVAFLPTPLAEAVLAEPVPAGLRLRLLHTGGDRLLRRPHVGLPFELSNAYGPTECTVVATAGDVSPQGDRPPHIGGPIDNVTAYVLGRGLGPVPPGAPGELCLGGAGVARGYRGRPDLTAERFVPDPFGAGGERLYRTGDLARRMPSGDLEVLGRIDHQVKIRGHRIELGEIEAALVRLAAVREAAVVVQEPEHRLVAYVVPAAGAERTAEPLRIALSGVLPQVMIPAAWVFLDALPLSPNGKVDRKALSRLAPVSSSPEGTAPRTPLEAQMAAIWAELLGLPAVGVADDLFALGGHSLLAARLVDRVRARLGVEMPLRTMFEAPTVAAMAAWVEAELLRSRPEREQAPPAIEPAGPGAPLSFAQQRLWFLDRLEPDSAVYAIPIVLRLDGALRLGVLSAALAEVVRRHEALRTTFETPAGAADPVQVIHPAVVRPLPQVDLGGLEAADAEAARRVGSEARRPFDLRHGPLLRAVLLRLGPECHRLLVDLHHIVADGGSVEILERELAALYPAFAAGRPSPLPELPLQYPDFALWQRRLLVGEELERQAAYWRVRLADPQASELPADRPRPAVRGSRGAVEEAELPAALAGALDRLGRGLGATPFMTLLAGFLALLHRYTGQDDLLVGTPVSGRGHAGLEGLIGFFVNTLPLRADLSGEPSFAEVVARVRSSALSAYAHQDLPFERLVAEAAPERDLSRNPLFQVIFAYLESGGPLALGPGLTLTEAGVHTGTAKFDLSFHVGRDGRDGRASGGLRLWLEYSTDLFDGATIRRLIGCFERLLEGAAARPDVAVATLPLLSPAERAQLGAWDRSEHRGHPTGLLHALFEAQARLHPEAVALVAGDTVLTYAELESRSALLARRLCALGAGPEVAVAVCLKRRADLVVTLLAVLRSGSFYVPIDPRYPEARRSFLVTDSGARIVVTEEGIESLVEAGGAAVEPVPENLAYLIYTSGSTGRPKAVAITHGSAVKLAFWAREVYGPDELAGVLAGTAVTFDLSVFELFVTLAWGGAVILLEDALALLAGPPKLPPGLSATLVNTVPSALAELLREGALPPSVRTVNLAGEALSRALSDQVYARPETERLYNLYGPSEDTTYSTWALVAMRSERPPSIGRPVHESRAYVVDRWLETLPLGVPGELCLAGDGLARGYLGRPDLTAERFVPDPFAERSGERMYRTGDLAKRRSSGPAGELEYLGRMDQQVKIRGYRIELGEIEAALARLPGVSGAAVLVRVDRPGGPGGPGGPRLVAYLAGAEDAVSGTRRALLAVLPEPMVPSDFVVLAALPLTPHGKVDRRALAKMALAPKALGAGEPLRTPIEAAMARVWSDLLGVEGIGGADDFFALGGHSLLATRLVALVRERFGVELPVRTVFQEPTVARLAAWIEAERSRGGAPSGPTLDPALTSAPLSFAQARLWFLDRLEPGSSVYNLPVPLELSGPLQPAALSAAVAEVVRRHAALRTTFEVPEGGADPLQTVHPPAPGRLLAVDLAALPAPRRGAEAARLSDAEAWRPFDLGRGPLLRTLLLRLGGQEHRLLATMHHIVSDGWSIGVLVGELAAVYEAFSAGRPSPLAELPVQYPDFAVWQRRWLSGGELERQLDWWRLRLADPPVFELPLDRPRPAALSHRGAVRRIVLSEDLTLRLERLGTSRGATPFMTHLGAFLLLLGRYTGQDDLLVGAPVAGRGLPEVAGLIGFFVNTLALRTSLAGDPSFEELLARVRESALAAYAHQDLPFEQLVAELVPGRDLSRNPLFQVMLAFESFPSEPTLAGGLTIEPGAVGVATAKFDLTLSVRVSGGRTLFEAEHSTDLFDPATVARFLSHLVRLLEGVADAPERRVSDLPLLTAGEAQQLLEWNDTSIALPAGPCLHELVEAQAARTPERPAVTYDGRSLTYRQLDLAANRLARRLRAAGAVPESVVGVLAERSLDQVVGLLAVLKAGAGYLPLDPDYPAERLAWMIADSRVPVVLVEERLSKVLPASEGGAAGACLVALDGAAEADGDVSPLEPCADPENLAYVIYTSGSTGRPKGTMVPHRAIASHLRWMLGALPLESSDRVLQKTSFAFDASVWEIWAPLAAGALLAIAPQGEQRDPDALVRRVKSEGATVLQVVPSLLGALLESGLGECRTLRRVCCGGEALTVALAEGFRSRLDAELINLYGPTETAVEVIVWAYERDGRRGVVPLGRPVSNTRIYLVDHELRPVPAGVHGELLIGGAQVGRGYLGRPDLTAERFVPDALSGEAGARLYRTGDLARWLPDGVLDFLGRIDHQVKLRGLRIELGEIEEALGRHPSVSRAVVVVREDRIGAWYLPAERPAGEPAPSPADLAAALREDLPEYMVPAWLEALPALPLLPNGKVDRRALERRVPAAPPRAARVVPGTPLEVAVAAVWSELLGKEDIGAADDFFMLGGHSLMAARLAVHLRERLGIEMPLRVIFQEPTVARLAAWIDAELRQTGAGEVPILAAGLAAAASPLSFAQQRLWFLDQLQPGSHVYNMPLDLHLSGPLGPAVLARAVAEVVRRHAALRTSFEVPVGATDPVQVVRPAAGWALPSVDLFALDAAGRNAEAARLARDEVGRPFDLGRWPLLRTFLLRLEPNGHRLLGTLHHIVSDGLSMELLQRELGALCAAFAAGRPSPLPALPVQYPDFAVWQRNWLSGGELERQLAWWRGRLATAPIAPILELPADRPRPAVWSHRGGVASVSLAVDLGEGLERLGRRHGATPFMTLLGAFFALLHRVTNQDELVVGAPVSGRSRPEVAGLIGLFVNTLALRVSLAGEPSFEELLARVRETALQSYAYQDLPFEKLVAELVPLRDLSRNPLVQVVFALHDAPEPVSGGDGLVLTAGEGAHGGTAKFDLSLHIGRIEGGMGVWAEYGADLFDRATVQRLLGGFENLLAGVFTQGEAIRVRDLPLLSGPERAQVVREWSDTATAYPRAATIHGLFEQQVRLFPDRVALAGEELTYAGLDLRAERLAARLRSLGVGPEERVGLFAERSADLIAALLGILKAGGAYLPLDPQSPPERLAGMLADAEVRVLVVQEGLLSSLPQPPAPGAIRLPLAEVLAAGPAASAASAASAALARTSVDPNNLAYVMFTSGSTGRPKGVAVTHAGVVRLVRETDYARLDEDCLFLQFAPVPFDASTFEIWGPLLNGGRLALFPPGPPDLRVLGETIERQGVTTMFMTTGLFHQMVDSHLGRLRPLRQLLTGGDVLSPAHMRRAVDGLPGTEVIAVYGPTEGTTFTTFHPVRAGDPEGPVPIGRPIANARAHVLDRSLLPAPVGVVGQLYIGGDGLARGYLARPELTAERFVPDSVGGGFADPGPRLYATGDLARWRPDGVLEFLGRADHQVKLRGFRIELGEIEALLTSHPEVETAVVVAREDLAGDKRLVAYVVPVRKDAPEGLETLDIAELRWLVESRLPAYMVPGAFVTLSELPLTGNGKIDRRALPAPEARVRAERTPPRTPLEVEVAEVWCEVLGIDRVWVEDSFWDLGGHSLLATRALARLADTFGVEIPLQALFVAPTLGGFSEAVGQAVLSDLSDAELHPPAEVGL